MPLALTKPTYVSVLPTNVCEHIVGCANRPPTSDELAAVTKLLSEQGVTVQYDPKTLQ